MKKEDCWLISYDILDRWKTYTGKLYNMDESKDDDADTSVMEKAASILVDEVREAIRRLPCGKTAANRNDQVGQWCYRNGVLQIVQPVSGHWWMAWLLVFVTIPKVKGAVRCEDHRTIALISYASKIFSLLNRMKFDAERQIADVQMGFRRRLGTRDQIFNLRIIMEKARVICSIIYGVYWLQEGVSLGEAQ